MMCKRIWSITLALLASLLLPRELSAQKNVADQVVWMVGDEPILLSDIEFQKLRMRSEGIRLQGKPDCFIPEQLAVQKLFLNQAKIDSIEANDSQIIRSVDAWLENVIAQIGSREKLEEYFGKKISQIREDERKQARNSDIVRAMQNKIVQGVQVTPSEIRAFFASMPQDSLPFIPKTVEVQRISVLPEVNLEEIDRVKERLRGFADEVNSQKKSFSSLARLYSEDQRTALQGGEYGFVGRGSLETEFANVVFNLSDPKRCSQIIKTEEGYHIVQLIEKRGDLVNFRHILLRPAVDEKGINAAQTRMDSIVTLINDDKLTFEAAAELFSEDKDTRNNGGLMINKTQGSDFESSPNFRYEELPQDIARVAYELKPGEQSKPFSMRQPNGQTEIVIIKLKQIHPEHIANMNSDYRVIKAMALQKKREQVLDDWIRRRQKETPIKIYSSYTDCDFKYPGWVRSDS